MTELSPAAELAEQTVTVPIDAVTLYPGNAKRHDIDLIREGLRRHGQYRPAVVQRSTGYVLVGNGMTEAARLEGWTELAVVYRDVDDEEARRLVLYDNRSQERGGGYDDAALAELLAGLPTYELTGYADDEVAAILAAVNSTEPEPPAPVAPDPPSRTPDPLPESEHGPIRVLYGECIEVMRTLPAESIDAVVCDPPYGLEFMGKEWDSFRGGAAITPTGYTDGGDRLVRPAFGTGVDAMRAFGAWCEQWATEALRVLKPGGHLLAFGGTRTYHRLASGIEDAGFEIRDSLHWLYGSGFPKSLDVSKAIDKGEGHWRGRAGAVVSENGSMSGPNRERTAKGAPITEGAARWHGFGTALKPSHEPCVLARKPLVGTVADNVLTHGTGALDIDGTRVGMSEADRDRINNMGGFGTAGWTTENGTVLEGRVDGSLASLGAKAHDGGRWPPNVMLTHDDACTDEGCAEGCPVRELDEQSGTTRSTRAAMSQPKGHAFAGAVYGGDGARGDVTIRGFDDEGGASRFFPVFHYGAKASRTEREAGLIAESEQQRANFHPTVKPVALMRWLVRLACSPGGTVLDPFAGSGTTLVAASQLGYRAIGIERDPTYIDIIRGRVDHALLTVDADTPTAGDAVET